MSSKYSISDDQLEKLFAAQESKIREIQGQVQYERDIEAQVVTSDFLIIGSLSILLAVVYWLMHDQ